MKALVSASIALLLSLPLSSHALTGNELHGYCQGESQNLCRGIVGGAVHGFSLAESVHQEKIQRFICLPGGVSNGQLIDIVKNYLVANPNKRHQDGYALIAMSVMEAYPCK